MKRHSEFLTELPAESEFVGQIGRGTYGRVYKCRRSAKSSATLEREEFLAVKRMTPPRGLSSSQQVLSLPCLRELKILKELSHPNVVALRGVTVSPSLNAFSFLYEFVDYDLHQLIAYHSKRQLPFAASVERSIFHQLLSGLSYLHENYVVHRDIKPQNILVSFEGTVKLGDFGLSGFTHSLHAPPLTQDSNVCTLWYRPPELLLGSKDCRPPIDLWSLACTMAEVRLLRPLFSGESVQGFQAKQLETIYRTLSFPSPLRWSGMRSLPMFHRIKDWLASKDFPRQSVLLQALELSGTDPLGDLLSRLLECDPSKRLTAEEALRHPFFGDWNELDDFFDTSFYPMRRPKSGDCADAGHEEPTQAIDSGRPGPLDPCP